MDNKTDRHTISLSSPSTFASAAILSGLEGKAKITKDADWQPQALSRVSTSQSMIPLKKKKRCLLSCGCSCHSLRRSRVDLFLGVLGRLFICTEGVIPNNSEQLSSACLEHDMFKIAILYHAPTWMSDMSLCATFANPGRPQFGLSFLRKQRPNSDFIVSVRNGDCEGVKRLLTKGEGHVLDVVYPLGYSFLQIAIIYGHGEMAQLLITHGAELTPRQPSWSPSYLRDYFNFSFENNCTFTQLSILHDYIKYLSPDARTLALETSFDVTALEEEGLSRFHKCILGLSYEALDGLCRNQRATVNDVDSQGHTAFHWATRLGQADAVLKLLMCGADQDTCDADGATALHLACGIGNSDCARLIIESGADIEPRDRFGATPLLYACSKGDLATVQCLLEHGANFEATNAIGETAIFYARTARRGVLQHLVERGADLNHSDDWGYTPLLDAAFDGALDALEVHLAQAPNLAARLSDGKTLLHVAARTNDVQVVELLLDHDLSDIDPEVVDCAGYMALECAKEITSVPNISSAFELLNAKVLNARRGQSSHEGCSNEGSLQ